MMLMQGTLKVKTSSIDVSQTPDITEQQSKSISSASLTPDHDTLPTGIGSVR